MEKYKFRLYNKNFPHLFQREKTKLKKVLPFIVEIEHFGSTAVPGLRGKGLIDIYILIPKNKIKLSKEILTKHKYLFVGSFNAGDGLRLMFERDYFYKERTRRVHVHVGPIGSKNFEKSILFRDNLRKSKELCREYEKIKKFALKKKNSGKNNIYVRTKEPFIRKYNKKEI